MLATALLVLALAPQVARASQASATITARVRVFQEYDVQTSGLQNAFEYVIEPVEAGAPLPVDDAGVGFSSFVLTREEDRWLEFPVRVTVDPSATPYAYHYVLRPRQTELAGGLYYVDVLSTSLEAGANVYPLEIHVQPSSVDAAVSVVVPTVHNEEFDGPKVADPGWRVAYAEPSSPDAPNDMTDERPEDNPGKGSEGTSGDTAAAMAAGAPASGSPLGLTGDPLASWHVAACAACGAVLLMCASALRGRAGDEDA